MIKKLSDFEGEKGIAVASDILEIIMEILSKPENAAQHGEKSTLKMFTAFMKNSPKEMMRIFAILSETPEKDYKCNGSEAMGNMLILANDPILVSLFTSQGQIGDAKSTGSASENTEGN